LGNDKNFALPGISHVENTQLSTVSGIASDFFHPGFQAFYDFFDMDGNPYIQSDAQIFPKPPSPATASYTETLETSGFLTC